MAVVSAVGGWRLFRDSSKGGDEAVLIDLQFPAAVLSSPEILESNTQTSVSELK